MSYYDDVCEYSYSQSYDSYESFGAAGCNGAPASPSASAGKASAPSAPAAPAAPTGATYQFCTKMSGSNTACGTITNYGGFDDDYDRTNAIACPTRDGGRKGAYVCNSVVRKDGDAKIGCGCLYEYKKDDEQNILEGKFLKYN